MIKRHQWLQNMGAVGIVVLIIAALLWRSQAKDKVPAPVRAGTISATQHTFLPLICYTPLACAAIPGTTYSFLFVDINPQIPPPGDAEADPGYNLSLLGYEPTNAYKGLIEYNGASDPRPPPQLYTLFGDERTPDFAQVYKLHNSDGTPITSFPVTMAGLTVSPNEIIHAPDSGYDIQYGYDAMVIYASEQCIALNYTRHDNLQGYTVYVTGICVEPSLLQLYRRLDAAGRHDLPVVKGFDPIGRAWTHEIKVVIRDTGTAMDPRSCKDWWAGRCP